MKYSSETQKVVDTQNALKQNILIILLARLKYIPVHWAREICFVFSPSVK